jgi:universal stress protein A
MGQYSGILLAVDFHPENREVAAKAKALADSQGASLRLVHVMEPVSIAYGGEFPLDLGELHREMEKQAREQLDTLAAELGVPREHCYLEIGITEREVLRLAKDTGIDLIVVGSHGRHGLALLLGSTANSILHHAECDVLAVRLRKKA